jgi:hypothetical protein
MTTGKRPSLPQDASTYPDASCADTDDADTLWLFWLVTAITPLTKYVKAGRRRAVTVYCTVRLPLYCTETRPAASASEDIDATHSKLPTASTLTGCGIEGTNPLPLRGLTFTVGRAGEGTTGAGAKGIGDAPTHPVAMTWTDAVAVAEAAPPSGTAVAVLEI